MRIGSDDASVSLDDIGSDDLTCEVCNAPLSYSGRGPKPKYCDDHKRNRTSSSTGTRRRSAGDVEAAMAAMEALYNVIGMALYPASPRASEMFMEGVPQAHIRNRMAFENDRELARQISSGASKGGRAMFYAGNAMLIGPALRVAYQDMSGKRKPKTPRPSSAGGTGSPSPSQPPSRSATEPVPPTGNGSGQPVDLIDMTIARSRQRSG